MFYSTEIGFTVGRMSDGQVEITDDYWSELVIGQASGKSITTDSSGIPILVDSGGQDNSEKRKNALSILSVNYQSDIAKLNIAWLAAEVSDGVNETAKKEAVIAQINDRKNQYAADRAAIIAKYPEE